MKKKLTRAASLICSLILLFTVPSSAQSSKLISFWDFNNTVPFSGAGGDSCGTSYSYSHTQAQDTTLAKTWPLYANYSTNAPTTALILVKGHPNAATQSYVDNGSGGSYYYDYSSNHYSYYNTPDSLHGGGNMYVRARNPVKNDTVFIYLPTTGYQNIQLNYAIEASGTKSGNYNIFSYSTNAGVTWKNLTTLMDTFNISGVRVPDTLEANTTTTISGWTPKSINFTSDASVNNNANVVLRWVFAGAEVTQTSANNRYDNFALTGDSLCPTFKLQPVNYILCAGGGNADFVVHTEGGTAVTYQWYLNTGSGFNLLPNGGIYSGATTDSLILTGATSAENSYQYECKISNVSCGTLTSNFAILTVDPALNSSISAHTNVTCFGLGSATVTVSGGTTPYTYLWSDPSHQTNITASSLSAGTYTITTTDNLGCSVTSGVTITQLGLVITLSAIKNVECTTYGNATATASNGTAPYTYVWSDAGTTTTATATDLTAGTYTITCHDITGCSNTATVTILQIAPVRDSINGYGIPEVIHYWDFNRTPPLGGAGGDSLGNPANPLPAPYSALPGWNPRIVYSHPSAIQTLPYVATLADGIMDNLTPGAAVNDLHILGNDTGSMADSNTAVRARNPSENSYMYLYLPTNGYQDIQLNYALSASSTKGANYNVFSYSTNGGVTWKNLTKVMDTFNISGVYRPDTMQAINPTTAASLWYPVNINFTSDPSINNNPNFVVRLEFEGPNSVMTSGNDRYDNISLSGNITTETCNGANNYTAVAGVKDGVAPFTYNWTPNVSSTATATGLSAGSYTVAVTDSYGCSMSSTVTVSQPTLVTSNASPTHPATCFELADGGATSSAGGGTPPYHYSWSSGQTTNVINGVSAGTYTVTVTDSYGCTSTSTATVIQPALLTAVHDSVADDGNCTGIAAVTPSGGTPPYTYLWTPDGQSTDTIKHQCARTYCCNITDKNGCTFYTCVSVLSTLGIDNITNPSTIIIYPDPNTGNFTIAGISQGQTIELYDYTGKKISSTIANNSSAMQFDITNKANGIYLIRILNKDGSLAAKNKIVKTQ